MTEKIVFMEGGGGHNMDNEVFKQTIKVEAKQPQPQGQERQGTPLSTQGDTEALLKRFEGRRGQEKPAEGGPVTLSRLRAQKPETRPLGVIRVPEPEDDQQKTEEPLGIISAEVEESATERSKADGTTEGEDHTGEPERGADGKEDAGEKSFQDRVREVYEQTEGAPEDFATPEAQKALQDFQTFVESTDPGQWEKAAAALREYIQDLPKALQDTMRTMLREAQVDQKKLDTLSPLGAAPTKDTGGSIGSAPTEGEKPAEVLPAPLQAQLEGAKELADAGKAEEAGKEVDKALKSIDFKEWAKRAGIAVVLTVIAAYVVYVWSMKTAGGFAGKK